MVGISSCLLGERVRFDGGHKMHSYISQTLGQVFEFRPFCPEVAIGLGTPRETIRLVQVGEDVRCVGTRTETLDVTDALRQAARDQDPWLRELCGYILKKDSPSCGMERVKVYHKSAPHRRGQGIYAAELQQRFPYLPLEEEGRLGDSILRENFVKRVFVFHHWRQLAQDGITAHALTDFHAQYKYVLLSHQQQRTRQLGTWLAEHAANLGAAEITHYFAELMTILKRPATRRNHANVLQHLQGFLKKDLDREDREELGEILEQYRLGRLPLIVPVTMLRHHFRRYPKLFAVRSRYLNPHPGELMLLNQI
jgi:uncharacterized protein YbgA (DUF1722 family)/uncharacterized protein YbbK (DUF523 family)